MRARLLGRWWLAGGLLVLLGVTACSGSSGVGGSAGGGAASAAPARNGAAPAAAASRASHGLAASTNGGAASSGRVAATTTGIRIDTGTKIRTAQITVSITGAANVASKADTAGSIAIAAGGDIDADDRTSGRAATATLRLLVPPTTLTEVLAQLRRLGREDSRQVSTRDVTGQVADVASRVTSARAAIARLDELYRRGGKVSDVIAIEGELAQRQADLESLEAQQRALSAQTSFATITLYLRTLVPPKAKPKPKHHTAHASGFVGGLSHGWHAFVTAAGAVAVAVGAMLPFLVVLALALIAARLAWPRLRRARPAAPTNDPTS